FRSGCLAREDEARGAGSRRDPHRLDERILLVEDRVDFDSGRQTNPELPLARLGGGRHREMIVAAAKRCAAVLGTLVEMRTDRERRPEAPFGELLRQRFIEIEERLADGADV